MNKEVHGRSVDLRIRVSTVVTSTWITVLEPFPLNSPDGSGRERIWYHHVRSNSGEPV